MSNTVDAVEIPIFPLGTVLFPGGVLPLKLFEARYLDMAARCMRSNSPFGVCLISEGGEVGEPAVPHGLGTIARIVDWDMSQPGLLFIKTVGGERFRILGALGVILHARLHLPGLADQRQLALLQAVKHLSIALEVAVQLHTAIAALQQQRVVGAQHPHVVRLERIAQPVGKFRIQLGARRRGGHNAARGAGGLSHK